MLSGFGSLSLEEANSPSPIDKLSDEDIIENFDVLLNWDFQDKPALTSDGEIKILHFSAPEGCRAREWLEIEYLLEDCVNRLLTYFKSKLQNYRNCILNTLAQLETFTNEIRGILLFLENNLAPFVDKVFPIYKIADQDCVTHAQLRVDSVKDYVRVFKDLHFRATFGNRLQSSKPFTIGRGSIDVGYVYSRFNFPMTVYAEFEYPHIRKSTAEEWIPHIPSQLKIRVQSDDPEFNRHRPDTFSDNDDYLSISAINQVQLHKLMYHAFSLSHGSQSNTKSIIAHDIHLVAEFKGHFNKSKEHIIAQLQIAIEIAMTSNLRELRLRLDECHIEKFRDLGFTHFEVLPNKKVLMLIDLNQLDQIFFIPPRKLEAQNGPKVSWGQWCDAYPLLDRRNFSWPLKTVNQLRPYAAASTPNAYMSAIRFTGLAAPQISFQFGRLRAMDLGQPLSLQGIGIAAEVKERPETESDTSNSKPYPAECLRPTVRDPFRRFKKPSI